MRGALSRALLARAHRPNFIFMTGDLGFMALEELRDAMGERFINAGVAEQNMVSVAAGLASEGMQVWVYSIAPFCYARPLEQIRNDVCLQGLSVKVIGNGGGYAYGVMGPTHHALEDYAVMLSLPHMRALLPAFDRDIEFLVERAEELAAPVYIRLGRDESPMSFNVPAYRPWRNLCHGSDAVVVVAGPLAGSLVSVLEHGPNRVQAWVLGELPIDADAVPPELTECLRSSRSLCVIEEHVAHGGLGAALCQWAAERGLIIERYRHLCARGYPSGRYGSQLFHRHECGLDSTSIGNAIAGLVE